MVVLVALVVLVEMHRQVLVLVVRVVPEVRPVPEAPVIRVDWSQTM
jgi:hypothetical protein